jgi:hypothetical protein
MSIIYDTQMAHVDVLAINMKMDYGELFVILAPSKNSLFSKPEMQQQEQSTN